MKRVFLAVFILWAGFAHAQQATMPLSEAAQHAASQMLTAEGSEPFLLRATIVETTNPESGYRGEVEEQWVSAKKWRRSVKSPDFSQTVIVNGDRYYEKDTGDYYPSWLRNLVTAMMGPIPVLDALQKSNGNIASMKGANAVSCARSQSKTGTPPAENTVFSVFCFSGNPALIESIVTPGMGVEFKDPKGFGNKKVARRLVSDPEPGTTVEAKITELRALTNADEKLFELPEETPEAGRMAAVQVREAAARGMLRDNPQIEWPPVRSGKTSGVVSVYVGVDRTGQVREVWPLNSDNAGLEDAVRAQVMKWHLTPASSHGVPVQLETIFTFAFNVNVANPIPVLSNEEARGLATKIVEAKVPAGISPDVKEFTIRVSVAPDGKITGVTNSHNVENNLFTAGYAAVEQWKFKPYIRDGKADNFDAEITFKLK